MPATGAITEKPLFEQLSAHAAAVAGAGFHCELFRTQAEAASRPSRQSAENVHGTTLFRMTLGAQVAFVAGNGATIACLARAIGSPAGLGSQSISEE